MFINYNFRCDESLYSATVAMNTILLFGICGDRVSDEGDEYEYTLELTIKTVKESPHLAVFRTLDLDLARKVYEGFCNVLNGGEPFELESYGYIQGIYPKNKSL